MSHQIFISYRRGDAADWAGRLYDYLGQQIGKDNVFLDVQQIAPGANFVRVLESEIERSDAVVLLIGPRWLSGSAQNGANRLANPDDFVRREIEQAIASGVPIVPVLVAGGSMPELEHLPASMRYIAELPQLVLHEQGLEVDSELILQRILEHSRRSASSKPTVAGTLAATVGKNFVISLCIAIAAVMLATIVFLLEGREGHNLVALPVAAVILFALVGAKRIQSMLVYFTLVAVSLFFTLVTLAIALQPLKHWKIDFIKVGPRSTDNLPVLVVVFAVVLLIQAAALSYLFVRNRSRIRSTATRERRLLAGTAEFSQPSTKEMTQVLLVNLDPDAEIMVGRVRSRLKARLGAHFVVVWTGEATAPHAFNLAQLGEADTAVVLVGKRFAELLSSDAALSSRQVLVAQVMLRDALVAGVHVTPLLLEGASMPEPDQLPEPLRDVSWRNATPLRHTQFDSDIEQVVAVIGERRALVRDVAAGFGRRKTWIDQSLENMFNGLQRAAVYSVLAAGVFFFGIYLSNFQNASPALSNPLSFAAFASLSVCAVVLPLVRTHERSWIVFLALWLISVIGTSFGFTELKKSSKLLSVDLFRFILLGLTLWFLALYVARIAKLRALDWRRNPSDKQAH